jgi:2-(3-amino-3-carboxypropyl)histidine synthase
MKTMSFDLEEKRLKREIRRLKPKIVLLQFPEGLKAEAPHLAAIIENAGALPIVSTDPCYGACDLAISEASRAYQRFTLKRKQKLESKKP